MERGPRAEFEAKDASFDRAFEPEHRRWRPPADGPGETEEHGEDGDALWVFGIDERTVRRKVRRARIGGADEGAEEDDLPVGEPVQVSAVDEVFGVAVPAVVVHVHADAGEAGPGEEKVPVWFAKTVNGAGSFEERGGDGDDWLSREGIDAVGLGEAANRGSANVSDERLGTTQLLPDKALTQALAGNDERLGAGEVHHFVDYDGGGVERVCASGTEPGNATTFFRGGGAEGRGQARDLTAAEAESVETAERVLTAEANDPGEVADCSPCAEQDGGGPAVPQLLADGLAERADLFRRRRVGVEVAFTGVKGAERDRQRPIKTALDDRHQFEGTAADIDEAAIAEACAVHDANVACVGFFVGSENAETDARGLSDAGDEVLCVWSPAQGLGADRDDARGTVGLRHLGDEPERGKSPFEGHGSQQALSTTFTEAGIETLLVNDFEGVTREFAGDEKANRVRTDIDDGDHAPEALVGRAKAGVHVTMMLPAPGRHGKGDLAPGTIQPVTRLRRMTGTLRN